MNLNDIYKLVGKKFPFTVQHSDGSGVCVIVGRRKGIGTKWVYEATKPNGSPEYAKNDTYIGWVLVGELPKPVESKLLKLMKA